MDMIFINEKKLGFEADEDHPEDHPDMEVLG
jgi:hypothetical protein